MADHRNQGRQNTHDTGAPQARARDDLRTASKKQKPHSKRNEQRDQVEQKPDVPAETNGK